MDKGQIDSLKNSAKSFSKFLQTQNDSAVVFVLEKLGKLGNDHSKQPLLSLLSNGNKKIRRLAIKNLAKIGDISLLDVFFNFAIQDKNTEVRREAVSAIGRLRNKKTISALIKLLSDEDPKVVLQAVRGLLIFPDNPKVKKALSKMTTHPNELVREMVGKTTGKKTNSLKNTSKHEKFPIYLKNTVVHGDVSKILKYVCDESVHLTFTSPPYYNARDYSIYKSYRNYLKVLESVFKEAHRITKEGRFFILNTSPIIIPRISRAHASKRYPIPYDIHPLLIKMGWEFIDDIVWIKPEASVKNRNAGFLQHRKPLGYKPNAVSEMLMVYRKKTDKLIDWNMKQYPDDKIEKSKVLNGYETTNIWRIDPVFDKVHSAVFPLELCRRVIKYYSFVGDLIFDPFSGSGTLGRAAGQLDRFFFLTERESKYISRIKENISSEFDLFSMSKAQPKFIGIKKFIELTKRAKDENN